MLPAWCEGHCQQSPCKKLPKKNLCRIFKPFCFSLKILPWKFHPNQWCHTQSKSYWLLYSLVLEKISITCVPLYRVPAGWVVLQYTDIAPIISFQSWGTSVPCSPSLYRQKLNKFYHVQHSIGCSKVLLKFHVITFLKVAIRASLTTQQAPCTWPCRATLQQHL